MFSQAKQRHGDHGIGLPKHSGDLSVAETFHVPELDHQGGGWLERLDKAGEAFLLLISFNGGPVLPLIIVAAVTLAVLILRDAYTEPAKRGGQEDSSCTKNGQLRTLRLMGNYDPANPDATRVEVIIDINSISTRDADRDHHLKGADFFDAERYPEMTFRSLGAARSGDGYKVTRRCDRSRCDQSRGAGCDTDICGSERPLGLHAA